MKALVLSSLVLLCLALSGCTAYSIHPLYTSEDAVVAPALEGTWIEADKNDPSEFRLQKSGAHEYSLVLSSPDSKIDQNYSVNLVRLGDQLFMDIVFKGQTIDGTRIDDPLGAVSTHVVVKVNVTGDKLAYATLDGDAIKKQNSSETLRLEYTETDETVLVTAQTVDLRRYLSVHPNDVFSDYEQLTRKTPQP
jgi:hypothetical protein